MINREESRKAEQFIADIIGGTHTPEQDGYDVLSQSGLKIEVKLSKAGTPNLSARTRRWTWTRVFGEGKLEKDFDYLVLVGAGVSYDDLRRIEAFPVWWEYEQENVALFVLTREEARLFLTPETNLIRKTINDPTLEKFSYWRDRIEEELF